MATLTETMQSVENEVDLFEYVRQVKSAVIRSVEELNPSVQIKDTGHFNHSAAPDLVLNWPGREAERPLYVRRSYEELAAGRDVQRLSQLSPVFLSVGRGQIADRAVTEQRLGVGEQSARSVLVTNAATVDMFTEDTTERSSPLTGAVAAEILPSGQGLLDQDKAAPVLRGSEHLLSDLAGMLSDEALASVTRVAEIVSAAWGAGLPGGEAEVRPFSMQEARELLPWLLTSEEVTDAPDFWSYIAERVTLKHLEGLADELSDVNLSVLCTQGWGFWQAQRGSLGVAVPTEGEARPDGWYVRGNLLTYEKENAAFRFSTYGQAIKERGSVSSASWGVVRDGLERANLMRIVLRGIARSIRIDANDSDDVKGDADSILASVADAYYVDEVTLRYGLADEDRLVRLLFGDQMAYNEGNATVKDLLTALARVGAYRDPVDVSGIAEL